MFTALHLQRAEHERSIALANRAADALEGVRHYKTADARLCSGIEAKCPGVRANLRYGTIYSYAKRGDDELSNWRVWTYGNGEPGNDRSQYACVYVQLPRGHSGDELFSKDPKSTEPVRVGKSQLDSLNDIGKKFYGAEWSERKVELAKAITMGAVERLSDLTPKEAARLMDGITKKMNDIHRAEAVAA